MQYVARWQDFEGEYVLTHGDGEVWFSHDGFQWTTENNKPVSGEWFDDSIIIFKGGPLAGKKDEYGSGPR